LWVSNVVTRLDTELNIMQKKYLELCGRMPLTLKKEVYLAGHINVTFVKDGTLQVRLLKRS
jgi:hypothetical protein